MNTNEISVSVETVESAAHTPVEFRPGRVFFASAVRYVAARDGITLTEALDKVDEIVDGDRYAEAKRALRADVAMAERKYERAHGGAKVRGRKPGDITEKTRQALVAINHLGNYQAALAAGNKKLADSYLGMARAFANIGKSLSVEAEESGEE